MAEVNRLEKSRLSFCTHLPDCPILWFHSCCVLCRGFKNDLIKWVPPWPKFLLILQHPQGHLVTFQWKSQSLHKYPPENSFPLFFNWSKSFKIQFECHVFGKDFQNVRRQKGSHFCASTITSVDISIVSPTPQYCIHQLCVCHCLSSIHRPEACKLNLPCLSPPGWESRKSFCVSLEGSSFFCKCLEDDSSIYYKVLVWTGNVAALSVYSNSSRPVYWMK